MCQVNTFILNFIVQEYIAYMQLTLWEQVVLSLFFMFTHLSFDENEVNYSNGPGLTLKLYYYALK